jgi:tRNA(Ile)-lysidine synthase
MIKLLGKIPGQVTVACSGGVDSMALLDFLSRKHAVSAAFFNHGTANSHRAEKFLVEYCKDRNISLHVGEIENEKPKSLSDEEHWRNERYDFLSSFQNVVTAHNLDDAVETWVWSSLHGTSKLIPYHRGTVTRPLLCTRKSDLVNWCVKNGVPWCEDASNKDTSYTRNFIRHEMMDKVLRVNPGIHKMIAKKTFEKFTLNNL